MGLLKSNAHFTLPLSLSSKPILVPYNPPFVELKRTVLLLSQNSPFFREDISI